MRTWKSLLACSLLAIGGAACGDDEGGNIDANVPIDSEVVPPDGPPTATRAMTIAVTDIELTSTQGAAAGMRGAVISVDFTDLTQATGGEVIFGTSPVGGCIVFRHDADGDPDGPHPQVDAGAVTISGPATGDSGVLKTVGPCAFNQTAGGYVCASGGGSESVVAASGGTGGVQYTWTGTPFTGQDLVGSYLSINGYTDTNFNSGTSALPIVAQTNSSLTVIRQPTVPAGTETATAQFAILNGEAPIPTQTGFPVDADFLGDETTSVRVQKAAEDDWAAIDFTVFTRGEGLALDDTSDLPHEFPTSATALSFSCSGAGGTCGADISPAPAGIVPAFIISGKTTDGSVTGLPDFIMPAPVTEYATFQCGFPLGTSGTVPAAAVEAILGTAPTRIETRVLFVAGSQPMDGLNSGTIVVGHGLVGHTTL